MKRYFLLVLLLLFWGPGFGGTAEAAVSAFVSIPPQRWLVHQIGGDLVNIHLLVQEGRNPHTFEPTPREVAALSRSSVWFVMGLEFEKQLQAKVQDVAPQLQIVDIAANLKKLPFLYREDEHHGEEVARHEAEHHHGEVDPHVWLSPPNLLAMTAIIGSTLAAADPEHAEIFRQNAANVAKQLVDLHEELSAMLVPLKGATFYVYHPSFGYFAAAYGLKQEPVELGGKSPSPRQLAKLIAQARREQVKVIFVQPQFDTKSGEAIAAAIQGRVVPLNALAENVIANLHEMAVQIKQAMAR